MVDPEKQRDHPIRAARVLFSVVHQAEQLLTLIHWNSAPSVTQYRSKNGSELQWLLGLNLEDWNVNRFADTQLFAPPEENHCRYLLCCRTRLDTDSVGRLIQSSVFPCLGCGSLAEGQPKTFRSCAWLFQGYRPWWLASVGPMLARDRTLRASKEIDIIKICLSV